MFVWRNIENHPLTVIKYPPYLFFWIVKNTLVGLCCLDVNLIATQNDWLTGAKTGGHHKSIVQCTAVYNTKSDWTSKFCDSISCDILSEIRCHYVMSRFIGWCLVLLSHTAWLRQTRECFEREKCIRMKIHCNYWKLSFGKGNCWFYDLRFTAANTSP